ncbi:uncharacterized protein IUM83_07516 [Phytophthora cinnamomi]|uniref:uncharacterized protein n=1 Tax=Phytophthora cinnamomi TaxID=4785 RepID=UPI00355A9D71|nr:hypothetical protein IUM83_07516 [Phytophthora cinnamomi]
MPRSAVSSSLWKPPTPLSDELCGSNRSLNVVMCSVPGMSGRFRAPGKTKEQETDVTTDSPGSHVRPLSPDSAACSGDMSKDEEDEDVGEGDGTCAGDAGKRLDEAEEAEDAEAGDFAGASSLGASAMTRAIRAWCAHWPDASVEGDEQRAPVWVVAVQVPAGADITRRDIPVLLWTT